MKVKMIFVSIAFFVFAQTSIAQTDYTGKLEFDLSVDQTEWNVGSKVMAKVTVKNISNEKLEIKLLPSFKLSKKGVPIKDLSISGGTYSSGEKESDKIVLKKEGNSTYYKIRQAFEVSLDKSESQTFEFEISKLGWKDTISSAYQLGDWDSEISKGEYELYYNFWFRLSEVDGIPRGGKIISNKIDVKLNSLK